MNEHRITKTKWLGIAATYLLVTCSALAIFGWRGYFVNRIPENSHMITFSDSERWSPIVFNPVPMTDKPDVFHQDKPMDDDSGIVVAPPPPISSALPEKNFSINIVMHRDPAPKPHHKPEKVATVKHVRREAPKHRHVASYDRIHCIPWKPCDMRTIIAQERYL